MWSMCLSLKKKTQLNLSPWKIPRDFPLQFIGSKATSHPVMGYENNLGRQEKAGLKYLSSECCPGYSSFSCLPRLISQSITLPDVGFQLICPVLQSITRFVLKEDGDVQLTTFFFPSVSCLVRIPWILCRY